MNEPPAPNSQQLSHQVIQEPVKSTSAMPLAPSASDEQAVAQLLQQADQLQRQGREAEAIVQVKRAMLIASHPQTPNPSSFHMLMHAHGRRQGANGRADSAADARPQRCSTAAPGVVPRPDRRYALAPRKGS